jgi:hypothetical protein
VARGRSSFFRRRMEAQLTSLYKDKLYGRAALKEDDTSMMDLGMQVRVITRN